MLIMFQNLQLLTLCIMQCVSDSFYINITLHLTGQLKILKAKFETFASKPDTMVNNRKHLSTLVNRHCKLAEFSQNIKDTFHLIIFFQLVLVTPTRIAGYCMANFVSNLLHDSFIFRNSHL